MREDIPAVDLSLGEDAVASTIRRACTTHGFFYVVNHGVSDEEVGAMVRAMKAFFALPEEKKRTVLQDENNRGWTPMGEETLDPATQVSGDTKEGYYIGREIAPDSPEFGLPLRGANNWPDESALGLSAPFRAPMRAYHAACVRLCRSLMRPFALALDMPPDFFDDMFTHPTALLRPLRYAAARSRPEEGVLAAGAHSDYGVLTALWTDGTPGLQILDPDDGTWRDVAHVPGALVCNVGDLCERWTNGVFKSTVHRVVTAGTSERFSAAFFWEPNFDAVVKAVPRCVTDDNPAKFPPVVYGEYILDKYRRTHAGFDGGGEGNA